jgi:hypothetical protein
MEKELTVEESKQYEEIAANMAKKYSISKVHVFVVITDEGERVAGYLKEPSYVQKLMAMDKIATTGPFMAGDELRESLTLKDESDARVYTVDEYKLGMASKCITMIEAYGNAFKKK